MKADDKIISPSEVQDDGSSPVVIYPNQTIIDTEDDDDDVAFKEKCRELSKKCCFVLLFLLAIILIPITLKYLPKEQQPSALVSINNSQTYLQIAEEVTQSCSFTNIKTGKGRGECQQICHDHSCCFLEDAAKSSYGCKNDPDKMCSVYIGCAVLFVPETEAVDPDVDSADTVEESDLDFTALEEQETTESSSAKLEHAANNIPQQYNQTQSNTSTNMLDPELELVSSVISTVCDKNNLHNRQAVHECADLCNSAICCFNSTEIYTLNPHMDIILNLEGVSSEMLDRSAMGTCLDEDIHCLVHSGCKNLLLIGSGKVRQPTSSSASSEYGGDKMTRINADEKQTLAIILGFFGITTSLVTYLLIFGRLPPIENQELIAEGDNNSGETSDSDSREII